MRCARIVRAALLASAIGGSTGCDRGAAHHALEASLGTYQDGSGRIGLALLATVRDGGGSGPGSTWTLTLRDGTGAIPVTLDYAAPGFGSYVTRWRADVAPRPGTYEVVATGDGETARTTVTLRDGAPLPLPQPALTAAGDRIAWAPVPGAAAYLCRVYAGGAVEHEAIDLAPGCDLSGLAPGAYAASVVALSMDPRPLASVADAELPLRFDASEATLALVRSDGTAPQLVVHAAGGAYDDGVGERSLAAWVSITAPDGTATGETWDLELTGPNLPASDPLRAKYAAGSPRFLFWAPGLPATPGQYTLTARSPTAAVVAALEVGAPEWLDVPFGAVATDGAQGSARVSWDPVAAARSYLASAYDVETGALVSDLWVGGAGVEFPAGTFVPGRAYEVFVAASDADMVWGAIVPTQVSVAENVFDRASFLAR